MTAWQYIIIIKPEPGSGGDARVARAAQAVAITANPSAAAHAFLMQWKSSATSAEWPRTECWARAATQPDVCGIAFGRDWPA